MTRIPSLAQALALLRATSSPTSRPAPTPTAAQHTTPGARPLAGPAPSLPAMAQGAAADRPALRRLPARLKALRTAEGRLPKSKALRLFIEAALLDELGPRLQLDPAFADLVERTSQALEADEGTAPLLHDALQELAAVAE